MYRYTFRFGPLFGPEADKVDTVPPPLWVDGAPESLLTTHAPDAAVVIRGADCLPTGHELVVDGSSTLVLMLLQTF